MVFNFRFVDFLSDVVVVVVVVVPGWEAVVEYWGLDLVFQD